MSDGRGRSAGTRKNYFKPGQSGNRSGKRNPGKSYSSFTQALRKIGFEEDPDAKSGASNLEVAARVMWWHANHGFNGQGSPKTIEAIASRLDGKPAETVTVNATVTQRSPKSMHRKSLRLCSV
jgi:hypothetical protein